MKLDDNILPAPGVYRIRNTLNSKCYVGSSKNIRNRASQHSAILRAGRHHSTKLRNAAAKYGLDAFVFEVVEHCAEDALLDRELHWINTFNAVDGGYNIRRQPSSNVGVIASPETRRKLSLIHKGKKLSQERRAQLSAAAKGRDMSAPVAASAAARSGVPMPASAREKIREALRGVKKSAEHAAKVAAAHRGRVASAETRQRISEAGKGRVLSEEQLERRRGRKMSPEAVAKRVEKMRGVPQSQEHIAKRVKAVAATKGHAHLGVSWHTRKQKWRARITYLGVERALGYFATKEDATAARAAAEKQLYHKTPPATTIAANMLAGFTP
jgi:group I intron endonuclease